MFQSGASTPSTTNNDPYHLKRSISSDDASRLGAGTAYPSFSSSSGSGSKTDRSTPIVDALSSSADNLDLNETKRRKIQEQVDGDHHHQDLANVIATHLPGTEVRTTNGRHGRNDSDNNGTGAIDNNSSTLDSTSLTTTTITTTSVATAIATATHPTGTSNMERPARTVPSRRPIKRVNYADPDDFDLDDEEQDRSPSRGRESTRASTRISTIGQQQQKQQLPSSSSSQQNQQQQHHRRRRGEIEEEDEYEEQLVGDEGDDAVEDEEEDFSDNSRDVKVEPEPSNFGRRTLRDRSAITAPKPFHVIHPTPPPVTRTSRNASSRQDNRRHYDERDSNHDNSRYRGSSSSNLRSSLSAKRPHSSLAASHPPPPPRPITENMRITRGMTGSLVHDSSNSRDVTPDQQAHHRPLRSSSRFHRSLSTDEERELETGDGATGGEGGNGEEEEAREDEDEEMMVTDAAEDSQQSPFVDHQDPNSGLTRMTRLRARVQSQPARSSRHAAQQSSLRSKSAHSQSRQDSDRKYDLRERPKNRPTYIPDRPVPSPTRPRTSRMNFGGNSGRDSFMRPRQNRSSLLEALARAGDSSEDDRDISSGFNKRRSGPSSDSRGSSSRILPMNMHELAESRRDVIASRAGGQLADTDPLAVGKSVDFSKVGGLDHHVKSLKEMVILPLLYPEVYSRFQMMPPRGVLFHGPPGTGKTLLARALASSCSTETQKVAFFMRKGADCLSKWVGEAERQLRLLFEEAKAWQPSIIFFDEIDGLCPVRSSKQEQIHASIVSTMLALMDGLDGRGQVIVIGATNRIDAIDPALRRPGRFDREFYFPLPNEAARRAIIDINTCGWVPALDEGFKTELARITTRYCGADIKALCTEAALKAIRRRYPQIYESNEKLLIDTSTIVVEEVDMLKSAKAMVPASYRVTGATASPLPVNVKPLLQGQFERICRTVDRLFPTKAKTSGTSAINEEEDADDAAFQAMGYRSFEKLKTFRPRVIISGSRGMGQRYLGPALLHHLEGCTVQQFDLAALMSESSRTPEAACVQFFIEVKRHAPSVIYIPHIDVWWTVMSDAVKATFSNLLEDLNPEDRILFLATSETPLKDLPVTVRRWFVSSVKGRVELSKPDRSSREAFFETLVVDLARPPTDFQLQSSTPTTTTIEPLKKAPPPQPRVPTTEEKKLLKEHDQYVLRELRISLRSIVEELFKERRFKPFFRPVEPEEFPDYYQIVKKPMDLTTMNDKVDDRMYLEVKEFLADVDQICENTALYNDIHDPSRIIYKARAFQDVAHGMISRLDPELIIESEKTAARVRQELKSLQKTQGGRSSRRQLGLEAEAVPDDPELFLRLSHRASHNNHGGANGVARGGTTGTGAEDDDEEEEEEEEVNLSSRSGGRFSNRPRVLKQEDLDQDLDDDMSGTSLSMSSSTTSLIAFDSDPVEPTTNNSASAEAATTAVAKIEEHGHRELSATVVGADDVHLGEQEKHSMDIDTLQPLKNDNDNDASANGIVTTASSSLPVDPSTTASTSREENLVAADHDIEMTSDNHAVNGSSSTLGSPTTATTTEPTQPVAVETIDASVADPIIPDQDPTAPEHLDLEPIKEQTPTPPPVLILDPSEVTLLRQALVDKTDTSTVEELDQLRAALYEDLWEHRLQWDKGPMLMDMNETVESITALHKETAEDVRNYNAVLQEIY
ncbi:ATPase AAA domain-containing protein 2B [Linnemannia hyalina]|uniref:ATPase AAA domain-containing protein 2B n=1 Tax=Linnemannia hyalina TaxID=64524 RepID=A0A9P7XSR5_9FUNG|nr:ATPase AAA domain-containing protein 2B [Linnemannia hyalina]